MTIDCIARCGTCSARLARDNSGTTCSPCRRSEIESMARRSALVTRDPDGARLAFADAGLGGVAAQLRCTAEEALDVVVMLNLLPPAYRRRVPLLRQLVALERASHIAAAEALGLSRWTVATYRRDLGLDRTASYSKPDRSAAAIA
jgi:hypothetical protein